ncbi:MAG: xylose isomerase [Clostridiales bacterium]|nr:MAG: xylose isomerase [Clostridiales bacterium]
MSHFKIGIMIDSLQLGFEGGIDKAVEIGADGFQMFYTQAEPTAREKLLHMRSYIERSGLTVSAVCGDIGAYTDETVNAQHLEVMKNVFNFAYEIGAKVVTGHVGVIPADKDAPAYRALHSGLTALGRMAKDRDLTFAIETGPEDTALLRRFLDELDGGIGVNFDPANLVMGGFSSNGADSVGAVAPYIVHTHAKDGVREDGRGHETPLGAGGVDFPRWMETLYQNNYRGFLTIERECGDDPVGDCTEAIRFLRETDGAMKTL